MKSNMHHHSSHYGFTLIELLIAIAIVSILTSIAIPSYQKYTRKAHYTEIIQAAAPFKLGVSECFQITGNLKNCKAGKNGVPKNIKNESKKMLISSISVSNEGIIKIIPNDLHGIKPKDTYILTPTDKNNQLIWQSSGGGTTKGYAQ